MQLLAGTDAGTGVRGHVRVRGGGFCCSAPQYGRGYGGDMRDTHRNTHTHTGTYTRMLHLPFSDLPLKKCPTQASVNLVCARGLGVLLGAEAAKPRCSRSSGGGSSASIGGSGCIRSRSSAGLALMIVGILPSEQT